MTVTDATGKAPAGHLSFGEALSSRRPNSFGFLRWVLAALVVVDHGFPLSGLNHGLDPMWQWSKGQDSFGGIAVEGFFMISGFLVCRSYLGSRGPGRYLWKRFLRIFPGFWVCLLVTAFVFAPLAWAHERGSLTSAFFHGHESPLHYLSANFLLHVHQYGIDGLFNRTPYVGAFDGSLWTLIYEFKCYLLLLALGVLGLLRHKLFVVGFTVVSYLLMLSWQVNPSFAPKLLPVLGDVFVARFVFLFMFGATLALYAERLFVDDRLGAAAGVLAILTLHYGGWLLLGFASFGYFLFWLAGRLPMHFWDRAGDLSYGTYIYAFPVQMTLADHGLQRHGIAVFILASLAVTTVLAFLSWHLVEKRALRLKASFRLLPLRSRFRRTGGPAFEATARPGGKRSGEQPREIAGRPEPDDLVPVPDGRITTT